MLRNNLRAVRKSRGKTLREVASAVQMDWAHLARVEVGKVNCSDAKKVALAQYFGLPLTELFYVDFVAGSATNEPVPA